MQKQNVGEEERKVSLIVGGTLAAYGLSRRSKGGMLLAALGAGLMLRGKTGYCPAYAAVNMSTVVSEDQESAKKPGADGLQIREVVTVNKSPEELYAFWRSFDRLPQFMTHLHDVKVNDDKRSHWTAKAPMGRKVEWDAEIINEIPNRLIAWQSLPGSEIASAGSVRFEPAANNRGTEVRITLDYNPPAGSVGVLLAKLLGEEPQMQVAEDLQRFKSLMETGETPTVAGQPIGERSLKGQMLDKIQIKHTV